MVGLMVTGAVIFLVGAIVGAGALLLIAYSKNGGENDG